jgi:flavin-dependent dehydrogenase
VATVRILGAGVSGLATALLLARRGFEVEVRDRGRGRFAGGLQVLESGSRPEDALAELGRLGFGAPRCRVVPLRDALLFDQDLRRFPVASSAPYAYMIRRGSGPDTLDTWLREAATEAGVRLALGGEDDGWRADVVATGPPRADGAARELVFRTDHPDLTAVLFDPRLTPTGYSYLFVREGLGTIGAAQVRQRDRLRANARAAFDRLWGLFPMRVEPLGAEKGLVMGFAVPGHLRHGTRWYVGEAAGVQDFLFGLGNRLALRSAALAAEALAGGGWDRARFRREIVNPMRVSVLGRALWEAAGPRTVTALCRAFAGGDFRRRLLLLQRPSPWRRALAMLVMARWRERPGECPNPVATWSRRREHRQERLVGEGSPG